MRLRFELEKASVLAIAAWAIGLLLATKHNGIELIDSNEAGLAGVLSCLAFAGVMLSPKGQWESFTRHNESGILWSTLCLPILFVCQYLSSLYSVSDYILLHFWFSVACGMSAHVSLRVGPSMNTGDTPVARTLRFSSTGVRQIVKLVQICLAAGICTVGMASCSQVEGEWGNLQTYILEYRTPEAVDKDMVMRDAAAFCFLYAVFVLVVFDTLLNGLLLRMAHSFTFGEAVVVAQGLAMFVVDACMLVLIRLRLLTNATVSDVGTGEGVPPLSSTSSFVFDSPGLSAFGFGPLRWTDLEAVLAARTPELLVAQGGIAAVLLGVAALGPLLEMRR